MAGDLNMTSRNKVFRGLGTRAERGDSKSHDHRYATGDCCLCVEGSALGSRRSAGMGEPEGWRGEEHWRSRGYVVSWLRVAGHKILDSIRPLPLALVSVR